MRSTTSPQPQAERWNDRRLTFAAVALITAGVLAAYHNSFAGVFLFDDVEIIEENPTIRSLRTVWDAPAKPGSTVAGRPLVNLTFALNYAVGGVNLGGYHTANLALHLATALTLFGVVRRTLRARPDGTWLATATALGWAVHPLQTGSVTYLAQRTEILGALFILIPLYAFVRGVNSAHEGRWRAIAWMAALLGAASKETSAVTPVLVLLYDRTFVAGSWRAAWREHSTWHAGLACSWLLLGWLIWQTGARGDTVGATAAMPWWAYALKQSAAIVHYLRLLVWPHPLVLDYGVDVVRDWTTVGLQLLLIGLLASATLWALVRRSAAGFIGATFFLLLAPSSSIVPVTTQTMAEHRMYLPLALIVLLALLALARCTRGRRWIATALVASITIAWAATTARRNVDYHDAEAMWRDVTEKRPTNPRGWSALAAELEKSGRAAEAVTAAQHALALDPTHASAHGALGNALLRLGRTEEAIRACATAAQLAPGDYKLHSNLGIALLAARRIDEAIASQRRAATLASGSPAVARNLAIALARGGQIAEALEILRTVAQRAPEFVEGRVTLGNTLALAGLADEAIAEFRQVLRMVPQRIEVWNSLGYVLAHTNRRDEAIRCYEEALRLDPENREANADLQRVRAFLLP